MNDIIEKPVSNKALQKQIGLLLQNHSDSYIVEVLDCINQQKKDSTSFLYYLEQFSTDVNDEHLFEVIDQILHNKGLIDITLTDVKPFSQIHKIYSLNLNDLNKLYEEKLDYEKVIVYVWTNGDLPLQSLNEICNIVKDKLIIKDTKMIFGTSIDETLTEPRIDFITYR
ncbi:MAG: hypothetical protein WCX48_11960 [Bacteroidales bacterium]